MVKFSEKINVRKFPANILNSERLIIWLGLTVIYFIVYVGKHITFDMLIFTCSAIGKQNNTIKFGVPEFLAVPVFWGVPGCSDIPVFRCSSVLVFQCSGVRCFSTCRQ